VDIFATICDEGARIAHANFDWFGHVSIPTKLLTQKSAVQFRTIFSAYNMTQMSNLWSREFRGAVTTPSCRGIIKVFAS